MKVVDVIDDMVLLPFHIRHVEKTRRRGISVSSSHGSFHNNTNASSSNSTGNHCQSHGHNHGHSHSHSHNSLHHCAASVSSAASPRVGVGVPSSSASATSSKGGGTTAVRRNSFGASSSDEIPRSSSYPELAALGSAAASSSHHRHPHNYHHPHSHHNGHGHHSNGHSHHSKKKRRPSSNSMYSTDRRSPSSSSSVHHCGGTTDILVVLILTALALYGLGHLVFLQLASVDQTAVHYWYISHDWQSLWTNNGSPSHPRDPVYITSEWEILRSITEALQWSHSTFPLSVRHESSYDVILHPVKREVQLKVPKFWIPPGTLNRGGKLVTKKVALQIGSYLSTPITGSARGVLDARTIFVGLTSYRNRHCRHTVQNIFETARFPHRIRVGIAEHISQKQESCHYLSTPCTQQPHQTLCKFTRHLDVITEQATLATGPTLASHIVHRLYRGEYYAMQVNVDATFVQDWDVIMIRQFESLQNEMAVVSTLLGHHEKERSKEEEGETVTFAAVAPLTRNKGHDAVEKNSTTSSGGGGVSSNARSTTNLSTLSNNKQKKKNALSHTTPGMHPPRSMLCNADFEGDVYSERTLQLASDTNQYEGFPTIRGTPQLQPFLSMQFLFARGHFMVNVPHDLYLPMVLTGYDVSLSVRAFSHGYDSYAPEWPVCFRRQQVVVVEEEEDEGEEEEGGEGERLEEQRGYRENIPLYPMAAKESFKRMYGIIKLNSMADGSRWDHTAEDKYGLGKVRDVSKFFTTFGIHVQERVTERHLCDFVSLGKMHTLFHDHLRLDGMGIDYKKIHFRFHELLNVHELLD